MVYGVFVCKHSLTTNPPPPFHFLHVRYMIVYVHIFMADNAPYCHFLVPVHMFTSTICFLIMQFLTIKTRGHI